MPAAYALHGHGRYVQPLLVYRLEVLDGEDVVRLLDELCLVPQPPREHRLPRRSVGVIRVLVEFAAYLGIDRRVDEILGNPFKPLHIAALAAEAEMRSAQRPEQSHRTAREALRRRQRPRQRQLDDQIGPAAACGFGSGKFRVQRRFAALHEIAAHNTYDRTVRAQKLPAPCDVILMPRVKRVILRNDPYYGHGNVLPVDFMICGRDLPFVRI